MFKAVVPELHAVMEEVRERTFQLVSHLDEAQLETVLAPIMSPLSWDLGHVAAYEDLWLNHRLRGRALETPVADGELHELVIRHELQHTETMLQAMALAGLLPPSFTGPAPVS